VPRLRPVRAPEPSDLQLQPEIVAAVTRIRQSTLADGPALAQVDLATWTPLSSPSDPPDDPDGYVFFNERTSPQEILVAEVEGAVAGYVKIRPATPLPSNAHVLQIQGLGVDPGWQGRGVGQALLEAAAEEARARGARKLSLRVLGWNTTARRLYERCGFVVEGVLAAEFLLHGEYVDDVLMALRLA
jgi:ribosomal protein S18 acetylase RimI-like enzyme